MSGKRNTILGGYMDTNLEHDKIIDSLNKRFKQQPAMKINYEHNACSLLLTWNSETSNSEMGRYAQLGSLLSASSSSSSSAVASTGSLNTFYNSSSYQRLIAMQHLLNQTRYASLNKLFSHLIQAQHANSTELAYLTKRAKSGE